MIKVICNAGPIIGLFDEVVIPKAVLQELYAGNRDTESTLIKEAIENGYIKVIEIRSSDMACLLYGKLHLGELETIIGAKEDTDIRFAIIDEKAARTFASATFVDTLGILGVLSYAKSKGKIEAVRPYMDMLIQNNYRVSDILYNQVLKNEQE